MKKCCRNCKYPVLNNEDYHGEHYSCSKIKYAFRIRLIEILCCDYFKETEIEIEDNKE